MPGRSIAPGGALHIGIGTKEDLRHRARVAHATVNQAVRLLEARGVIEVRPGAHGGLFVAPRSPAVRLGEKLIALRGGAIAQAGANDVLSTLYLGLMDIIEEEALLIAGRDDPHERLPIHVDLVEAIAERDSRRAARAVSRHSLVA